MMHPAFSAAPSPKAASAGPANPAPLNALASRPSPSALSSSLLDPKSSTLAFSHDYLKAKAGVADLKLKVPNSSTNVSTRTHDSSITRSIKDRTSSTPTAAKASTHSAAQDSQPAHSTLSRLQNRSDPSSTAQDDSNADSQALGEKVTDSNSQAQSSSSVAAPKQKLYLATLALNGQRLPTMQDVKINDAASLDALANANPEPSAAGDTNILKTVTLSEQTQLITPQDAPNEKSLADFARAMGFDETQVATLFGPQAAQTMISTAQVPSSVVHAPINASNLNASGSLSNATSTLTSTLGNASLFSLSTTADQSGSTSLNPLSKLPSKPTDLAPNAQMLDTALDPLSTRPSTPTDLAPNAQMLDTALDPLSTRPSTPTDLAPITQMPHTDNAKVDLNALSVQINSSPVSMTNTMVPSQVALAGLAANTQHEKAPSTTRDLAQLILSEGIEAQDVQVSLNTTGKAASASFSALAISTAPTSTLAILNMTGSKLSGQAIDALQKEFNKLKGTGEKGSESSAFAVSAPSDSGLASSAQLNAQDQGASSGNSGNGSLTGDTGTQSTQGASTPINMAETYEKLSEQLTAELSKRMHEQISQGQWKMKFALKPSTLGVVDVQLEMKDGKLAAIFQADNALTQNLLQHASQELKDNLKDIGLHQTYVQVDQQNGGQAQHQGQESNARNPFEPDPLFEVSSNAQDSSALVDASMKVKNNDSLLDLMA
jgi:flagellar hook-length control protein FliK